MPNLASMGTPGVSGTSKGTQPQGSGGGAQNPFVRASIPHEEACGYDVTRPLTGNIQQLPDIEVPAYGYMRYIRIQVEGTGFSGGSPVFAEDAPFNALSNIVQQEPNGSQLHSYPTGWWVYAGNRWCGFRYCPDPKSSHTYGVSSNGSFKFSIYIPTELNFRDALGTLPNQNSAANFRIRLSLNSVAEIFDTAPTTLGNVRIRAYFMGFDQPEDQADGQSNATVPPAMNTTSFFSQQQFGINNGNQNIRLTRVGNYVRNLVFVLKATDEDAGGKLTRRAGDAAWPDPATLYYDTRPLDIVSRDSWLDRISSRFNTREWLGATQIQPNQPGARDAGVFPYDFEHEFDGRAGMGTRDQWLRTLSSTRLELGGQWSVGDGNRGVLYVLTNDVVTVGNVFL